MDSYTGLTNLKDGLKEYRGLLKQLYPDPPLTSKYQNIPNPFDIFEGEDGKIRKKLKDTINSKREALVEKASYLSPEVTKHVKKDTIIIYEFGEPREINVWDMGLRSEYDYRTAEALNACIDYTIKAIGMLKTQGESWGIDPQKLEKVGNTKAVHQKLWYWIKSHKVISIIFSIVIFTAAVVAIIQFFLNII